MVVNSVVIRKAADSLGWTNLNMSEVGDWLTESGIDPADLLIYMTALAGAPSGLNVSTLSLSNQGSAPYITEWFEKRGYVYGR